MGDCAAAGRSAHQPPALARPGRSRQLRANLSLQSPAGRHALRLAVIVPGASLIARELPLHRSYWLVVAAATVLRPEFGATFTRGTERALGTCLGVGLAGAIAVVLHPAGGLTVGLVGLFAWAGYAVFPASFAVGFAFITALVVFLLNAVSPDTLAAASARLLDTLVGGTIGLLAYALWPTWSHAPAWQSLADLADAERAYLNGVLSALIDGRRPSEQQMTRLSRPARLARTNAESTVARSLSEPTIRRIDARRSQGILGAMRRLIQASHVLRLAAQDDGDRDAMPELEPLRAGLDELLGRVELSLRAHPDPTPADIALPDLRRSYRRLAAAMHDRDPGGELLTELDELVDATNGLASLAGLESVDPPDIPELRNRRGARAPGQLIAAPTFWSGEAGEEGALGLARGDERGRCDADLLHDAVADLQHRGADPIRRHVPVVEPEVKDRGGVQHPGGGAQAGTGADASQRVVAVRGQREHDPALDRVALIRGEGPEQARWA